MRRTVRALAAATLALVAGPVALAAPASAEPRLVPISGAGSTWAANAVDTWRSSVVSTGVTVSYASTGSADGRNQFAGGTVDFAVTDVAYAMRDSFRESDPVPERPFRYAPFVGGGLAFGYNLRIGGRQVTNLRLSGSTAVQIFTREITRWDDPRVKADNPALDLPAQDIVAVARQDSSGATAQLTQWMSTRYPELWRPYCEARGGTPPCGPTASFPIRGHVGQSGSAGVSGYVAHTDGAIGYMEYSYAVNSRLPSAKVLNQAGYYVEPTSDAVAVALTAAEVADDLTQRLDRVYANPDLRAYPLSAYSYLVVPSAVGDGFTLDKGYTLGRFASYAICEGQRVAASLGYAPLPINLVRAGFAQVGAIPGAAVPEDPIAGCDNPTFDPDGTDTLLRDAPQPRECDNAASGQQCPGTSRATATTTTLSASEDSIREGEQVTLNARVTPGLSAGWVEFRRSDLPIAAPVDVVAGLASLTTTLPLGSHQLTARFTPVNPDNYAPSVSAPVTVTVTDGGSTEQPRQTLVADVAAGGFSLAVAAPSTVLAGGAVGGQATGALAEATVTDLRGTAAGWSLTAQVEDFAQASGTATIAGAQLGWTPSAARVSGSGTVVAGAPVTPGTAPGGLGDGATLCFAGDGTNAGTFTCDAGLTLRVPDAAAPGSYSATLTLTLA